MDRRHFLKSSAFFTIAAATDPLGASRAVAHAGTARKGRYLFQQGVASGDPRERSIVFWTRCTPARSDAQRGGEDRARVVRLRLAPLPPWQRTFERNSWLSRCGARHGSASSSVCTIYRLVSPPMSR